MARRSDRHSFLKPVSSQDAPPHSAEPARLPQLSAPIALVLIAIAALVLLWPLGLGSGIAFSKHSDIISDHLSVTTVGLRSLTEEGRFPLWDPSMNCGTPAFANPQSMYLFPLDLLYLAFPLQRATNIILLLNVMLAGVAMYVFGRRFFRRPAVALFAAIAYMLSFPLPGHGLLRLAAQDEHVCPHAAAVLGLRRGDRTPYPLRTVWVALVVALCGLQGDMQLLYYATTGCCLYVLVRLACAEKARRRRATGGLLLGGIVGAMLAMPAWLPRIEFARLSTRDEAGHN